MVLAKIVRRWFSRALLAVVLARPLGGGSRAPSRSRSSPGKPTPAPNF